MTAFSTLKMGLSPEITFLCPTDNGAVLSSTAERQRVLGLSTVHSTNAYLNYRRNKLATDLT